MANKQLTADITNAFGPSGYEEDVVEVIKRYTTDFQVKVDPMHNVYARFKQEASDQPVIQLDAHSDELGFMVQSIRANGMIDFLNLGGWILTNVPAHQVVIKNGRGEYVKGITSSKPPHFMSAAEKSKYPEQSDITIDVGATSRDEVMNLFGIQPGDPIMPDVTCLYNPVSKVFMSKAFDNRIGCQCIIETMENLKNVKLQINPVGAFAAQEEVGCRGAKVTAQVVKPDFAIVFEGSPSDDFFTDQFTAQCRLKHGVQIRVIDGGMISHAGFLRYAKKIAEAKQIPYQIGVRRSGSTDGSAIHTANHAVPCLVLGIPTRYAHTHYCYLAEEDLDATIRLATEIIKSLNAETMKEITGC